MAENQIPAAQRHAADTILEAAPNLSLLEFFDKAAYLYYCMDGEILDPSVYFDLTNDRDSFTVGRDTVENLLERKENEKFHNSYQWEFLKGRRAAQFAVFVQHIAVQGRLHRRGAAATLQCVAAARPPEHNTPGLGQR